MIRNLLTTTAAGLALGFTLGAMASAANANDYVNPHTTLLDTIEALEIEIVTESELCTPGTYGFFGGVKGVPTFGVCTDNITTYPDLYNTIRHEAIHVAQLCKAVSGYEESVEGFSLLQPTRNDEYMTRAQDNGWPILSYEPYDWEIESEAFVLSNTLTADEINQELHRYCF